jgi:hypothetical protein
MGIEIKDAGVDMETKRIMYRIARKKGNKTITSKR